MSSGAGGRVSEQMSAVERASNASSVKKAKECAVRVNTRGGANGPVLYALIYNHSTQCAAETRL